MSNTFLKISIIIPVLNDEVNLSDLLFSLTKFRDKGHEVVVVDGGSRDNSLMLAHDGADIVVVSKAGRAVQMNCGAAIATGHVFLFLHCDTVLPADAPQLITDNFQEKKFWGRFDVRLSSNKPVFRLIETLMNFRSRLTSIITGDQALFVDRELFNYVGGFPEIALMEDIAISQLLRKTASPVCFKQRVITSSRRWEKKGVIKTVLLMWMLRLLYFFGVSPDTLNRLYR